MILLSAFSKESGIHKCRQVRNKMKDRANIDLILGVEPEETKRQKSQER